MIDFNGQTSTEGLGSDANYEKSSSPSAVAAEVPGGCCCDIAIDDDDNGSTGHRTGKSNKVRSSSGKCHDSETRNNIENVATVSPAVRRVRLAAGLVDKSDNAEDDEKLFEDSFRERALEEKCGVFGVISNGDWPTSIDVAHIICLGLVGLQHRGQESAGIVTCKYKTEPFNVSRSEGLVSSAFNEMSMMSLKGNLGIGHTRYSTSGGSGCLQLAQPFVVHTKYGTIAVAHNGELVNSSNLRETLLSHGVGLTTGGDSELITQCLSQTPPDEFKHPKFRKKTPFHSNSNGAADYNNHNSINYDVNINGNHNININDHHDNTNKANGDATNTNCYHQQHNNQQQPKQQQQQQQQRSSTSLAKGQQQTALGTPIWKTDLNVDENNITSRLLYLMSLTPVSYSLLVMYNECLYATRDPFGNRPLTIGMLVPPPNAGDIGSIPFSVIDNCFVEGWCVSSESCPFPSVHAKLKRDVEPGEIIKFERNKMPKTLAIMARPPQAESPSFCIFEYVYFARPDSILERQTVYTVRKRCGERLADESPAVKSDLDKKDFIVAPVPESSIPAALGYSQRSGIPYVEVFCKNRYVGRTFIQPSTRLRRLGVAKKFGPLTENFVGKSIILIDDSIVRGTTIGQLVRLLREAGAKEVHIRIASPPLHFPCYMGINIPTKEELIANHLSPEQLALTLGAASLKYLSVDGLRESVESGIKSQLRADKRRSVMLPEVGNIATNVNMLSSIGSISLSNSSNQYHRGSVKNHSSNYNNSSASSSSSTSGGRRSRSGSQVGASVTLPTGPDAASANANEDERNDNNNNISDDHTGTAATDAHDLSEEDDEEERELRAKVGHCDACLTGRYPVELDDETF